MDHAARRARLVERLPGLGADALLVTRRPNVRYLSGFSGSNGQLVVSADRAVFLTDGRYTEQSRREAPDLERTTYGSDLPKAFSEACRAVGASRVAFEAEGMTYHQYTRFAATGVELVPTTGQAEALRWVKEPEEHELIRAAQSVTDAAFERVVGKLVEGATEKEVAFELEAAMRREGADGVAFETIVAFGENAAEPHHSPTDRPLGRGEMVKMDLGGLVGGYHADMTRTVAFGDPPARLRHVYEVVLAAQRAGIDAVKAGAVAGACDEAARAVIRDAGLGEAFTHSLGHGVGLEIHEPPWLRRGGEHVLPEGTVVTVEPGIYLDGVGGVRIEDMVEVTADGCRPIATSPRELLVL